MLALIAYGPYLWDNFSGIVPILRPSSKDIEKILEKPVSNTTRQPENNTQFPLAIPLNFSLSIFANNLTNPRVIIMDPAGNLLTSIPSQGKVVALPDLNHDGIADEPLTLIDNLNQPHGMAFRCQNSSTNCKLYVAETDGVRTYDYTTNPIRAFNEKKIIDLPGGAIHFTRTLLYDQKIDKLFIAVGSDCNACVEKEWRRTKILIADPDGKNLRVYSSGLRNSVFMTFHPNTHQLWATEMGRDYLGDNLPPDEINIIKDGKDYGWPYCYGNKIADHVFAANHSCRDTEASYIDIPAHSAPLGLAFFPQNGWPQDYQNNLLVAYHGSWNRSVATGYKIVRYKLDPQGKYIGEEDFLSGWLEKDNTILGRPAGILITDNGTIYISDDKAGLIYKMEYLSK